MSHPNNTALAELERELQGGAYDHCMIDLLERPPLSHYDMVRALDSGQFMVEGERSEFTHAMLYADWHSNEQDVWRAMNDLDLPDSRVF